MAVVIDKLALRNAYGESAAHPYHLGLGFLLQRFGGYLNHINRVGDVMAESRGGVEDRLLKESYTRVFERGVWMTASHVFQGALTSRQLKLKPKSANIAGLQLADLLGHPVKQWVLKRNGLLADELAPFTQRLMGIVERKFVIFTRVESRVMALSSSPKNKGASFETPIRSPLRAIHLRLRGLVTTLALARNKSSSGRG